VYENAKDRLLQGGGTGNVAEADTDKVKSTLRQFVRDWSHEGELERASSYNVMLELLTKAFPHPSNKIQVLVPGSGLGRLAYEVVKRGYACQGNEFSFYMLIASNFVLNKCSAALQYTIHPWIHSGSNHLHRQNQLRQVKIPDEVPGQVLQETQPPVDFSMVAGDFYEVYTEEAQWNCVMTCFFIDTSKNPIACIRRLFRILKHGGVWINLGPLLYHFEGMEAETTLELSLDEVIHVAKAVGFQMELEPQLVKTTYCNDVKGMLTYEYTAAVWVARKM
jgi:carnosine N-methyltransferase